MKVDTIALGSNLFNLDLEFHPKDWFVFRFDLLIDIKSKITHYELLKNATRVNSSLPCETVSFGHLLAISSSTNNTDIVEKRKVEISDYCANELKIDSSKIRFELIRNKILIKRPRSPKL